jgi:hypothetical protein
MTTSPVLVQDYLRTRVLAELARDHGVYASFSKDRRKMSLNYDQIEAKESDALARQCRGLILGRADGSPFDTAEAPVGPTAVLARPFDRFFNHGQHGVDASALLGREGTRVYEKLDGTLCIVYFDRDRWAVATRSVPDADVPINGFGELTFRKLFDKTLDEFVGLTLERLGAGLDGAYTYMFELTSPYNRVVCEYERCRLHLLAVRHTQTGAEKCVYLHGLPTGAHVPRAPSKLCNTLGELLGVVTAHPPTQSEGVVVCGPNFERVKVKNPAWVALSAVKSSVANSPRRLMELVLLEKLDDVLPLLPPDIAALGEAYQLRFTAMSHTYDLLYTTLRDEASAHENPRKALALTVQARKLWMPFFMDRFTGKSLGFRDFIESKRDATGSWPDAFLDNLLHNMPTE